MKKIVCELCEGTVFDKVDGRFVCKGCGTSYSVEEAKSMMQEVEGETPVGTGAPVSMPQGNPNQQQIDNILLLASSAYEADNKAEAENYCNQAIVLDATCYKAWLLKGRAVGWQSTVKDPRIEEASHSFCKAIDFAPEDEKDNVKEQAVEELKNLGLALIRVRGSNFGKYPDDEELAGFTRDRNILIEALTVLLSHGNVVGMPDGYLSSIATIMNNAAVDGFNTVSERYHSEDYPDDNDWRRCINEATNCQTLLQMAIDACDDDDEEDIKRYENMIAVLEGPLEWCSYEQEWSSYLSKYVHNKHLILADSAKKARKDQISDIRKTIEEIKNKAKAEAEAARKARIDAYWEAHAEEKASLESEKKELIEKRDNIQKELSAVNSEIQALEKEKNVSVPSEAEKSKIEDQIRDLNNRRASLGMFAGKEKKQIAEEIASLEGRIDSLKSKIEEEKREKAAEVEKKLSPAKARKNELDSELAPITKRISA